MCPISQNRLLGPHFQIADRKSHVKPPLWNRSIRKPIRWIFCWSPLNDAVEQGYYSFKVEPWLRLTPVWSKNSVKPFPSRGSCGRIRRGEIKLWLGETAVAVPPTYQTSLISRGGWAGVKDNLCALVSFLKIVSGLSNWGWTWVTNGFICGVYFSQICGLFIKWVIEWWNRASMIKIDVFSRIGHEIGSIECLFWWRRLS